MPSAHTTMDGNEAVARMAYALSEVMAIYPITPASPLGEWADQWSSEGETNLWDTVPRVVEMQSEAGVAGATHGALQTGALTATFTASQGLLLMIPVMYKLAGQLTPLVLHVAARSLAAQGLSIFCDHSDVMAARATGFVMLASNSVQEAADHAVIAHAATLESRLPILHFFDGFRTSHEIMDIDLPTRDQLRAMIDDRFIHAHRDRALSPEHPVIRGTAQNPDVYFQGRETVNPYYLACPMIIQQTMDRFAELTGRQYQLYDYYGDPDAERVIVLIGSGAGAVQETVDALRERGEKVGMLAVRLFRPFVGERFMAALPPSVKTIAVLDRTKEPGSIGEPLYQDVLTAVHESGITPMPRLIGGRYGLSSKEFTPAMVRAVFDECTRDRPRNHFTLGIRDDVTHTSLDYDPSFSTEDAETVRAVFYGLGSDGTVGANKNSIKIIGDETDLHAQGYFVYDSKKSGSVTISHLRFGPKPIRSTYLISRATFVACHQFAFLEQRDVLKVAEPGAVFLLNSPFGPDAVWEELPRPVQTQIIEKNLRFYVIDALKVASELGMGGRINTVMQTCFFALSEVLPREEAIEAIKHTIAKTYGKRGQSVVYKNCAAVDAALAHLHEVAIPSSITSTIERRPAVAPQSPEFVRRVTSLMIVGDGDEIPVSAMPVDGTYPVGTTQWEKRNIAAEIPVWDPKVCIQCGKCVLVCPHAVIRGKIVEPSLLNAPPAGFMSAPARWPDRKDQQFILQVAPEDCTGCALCVEVCPAKNKSESRLKAINMRPQAPIRERERDKWEFFHQLPEMDRQSIRFDSVKDLQLVEPLFEFSGACAGCGETPYLKLMTQLFGDRAIVANATGCSSIYGGNLPTTPWTTNRAGRGPAWANSLFEDNAEFGLGMRVAIDKQAEFAVELVLRLADALGDELVAALLSADQSTEAGIIAQRERVRLLKAKLSSLKNTDAADLLAIADMLVKRSVWIIGGDGWAYDIGFGGLDHVIASGQNVNLLVLDTEVYSNTGGQMSKSTPRGAVAKFAAGGKQTPKKDLALIAMTYGTAYVARVAMGGSETQLIQAFREAEAFPGPSLIIAYSHCIAHGYDLVHGMEQQKLAVQSGYWPLMRFNPSLIEMGKNPLQLDSGAASISLRKYTHNETRYTMLAQSHPEAAEELLRQAEQDVAARRRLYENWAAMPMPTPKTGESPK